MNLSFNANLAKGSPLKTLQDLGIKFSNFHYDKSRSIVFLFDCENVPVQLPEYIKIEKQTPPLNRSERRKFAKRNR